MSLESIKSFVNSIALTPEDAWPAILPRLREKTFAAKSLVLKQGEKANSIFFVVQGILKAFYLDENGEEFTKGFIAENWLAAPYVSILTGQPSSFGIQALEDTQVVVIPSDLLPSLYPTHPAWEQIGRRIAERLLIERERREYQMLLMDASKRYEQFLKNFTPILDRIPQYEIASYIGITPVALSQIRARRLAKPPGSV